MGRFNILICCFVHFFFSGEAWTNTSTQHAVIHKAFANVSKDQTTKDTESYAKSTISVLKQIQNLRQNNQLDQAKNMALDHLHNQPNDVDVALALGLIYFQQNNNLKAEEYLNLVLEKSPSYLDARIGLIRVKLAEKKYQEAVSLVNSGLAQYPNNEELSQFKTKIEQAQNVTAIENPKISTNNAPLSINQTDDSAAVLKEIQNLRKQGKTGEAKSKAIDRLKSNPDDVDVQLVLGLIYLQQKDYELAEDTIQKVLTQVPNYMDARVGLIKLKIEKKEYQEAKRLIDDGLKTDPKNIDLLSLKKNSSALQNVSNDIVSMKQPYRHRVTVHDSHIAQAKKYAQEKKYDRAKQILKMLLIKNSDDVEARIALADIYLDQRADLHALHIIKKGLVRTPNNAKLLVKEGEIRYLLRNYAFALNSFKKALIVNPKEQKANDLTNVILESRPGFKYGMNEIGIQSNNAYVSDLKSIWDYSSLYYKRDTDLGPVAAKVNYASRLGKDAPQLEVDFSPRLNRHIYFDLMAAFSNEPSIFPKQAMGVEGYFDTPIVSQVSLGAKYSNIGNTYFSTYTGSLNFYPGNYWFSLRPYYFVPKSNNSSSVLYSAVARRYFDTVDHYISLSAGTGRSPDLADLLTVNFIIIQNNFINLNYEFPILEHRFIIDVGVGYMNWRYPSGLVRNLYDGTVGLKYRF